jgi:hypothetical protein
MNIKSERISVRMKFYRNEFLSKQISKKGQKIKFYRNKISKWKEFLLERILNRNEFQNGTNFNWNELILEQISIGTNIYRNKFQNGTKYKNEMNIGTNFILERISIGKNFIMKRIFIETNFYLERILNRKKFISEKNI